MLCPGPVFSNLLEAAATEKAGEVSFFVAEAVAFVDPAL